MRPTADEIWLNVAKDIARRGTCLRRQVGCVLVDARGQVLSTGYNGVAHGMNHCSARLDESEMADRVTDWGGDRMAEVAKLSNLSFSEYPHACPGAQAPSGQSLDGCHALHAEQNALLQCRDVNLIHACYVTASPCLTCTKLLMNTSCVKVVFAEQYAHDEVAKQLFLSKRGKRDLKQPKREWRQFDAKLDVYKADCS